MPDRLAASRIVYGGMTDRHIHHLTGETFCHRYIWPGDMNRTVDGAVRAGGRYNAGATSLVCHCHWRCGGHFKLLTECSPKYALVLQPRYFLSWLSSRSLLHDRHAMLWSVAFIFHLLTSFYSTAQPPARVNECSRTFPHD